MGSGGRAVEAYQIILNHAHLTTVGRAPVNVNIHTVKP